MKGREDAQRAYFGALWQRSLGGVGGWGVGLSLEYSRSAPCARSEVLSSFEPGCMCVAYGWVTCKASNSGQQRCCTPALWRRWYRRPKQRNRWHSRAASVWDNLCGGGEGRRGPELTHLVTGEGAAATMGHSARGGTAGFEDWGPEWFSWCLLRFRGSKLVRGRGASARGGCVAQVCVFHFGEGVGERRRGGSAAVVSVSRAMVGLEGSCKREGFV